ncbi:MAG: GIY-YIG nuclease family protein [Chitinophagaceae bacterium]|nr:GIY-YIG nuclease family protein [Chitinophagaceae bacterium]MBK8953192.1 GIY-YIG nuclease family protein [Chitinophagaceae bacterium]
MKSKKEIVSEYKTRKLNAGLFQIKNLSTGKVFIKQSPDLERAYNSDRFQLKAGMHSNAALQQDWNILGETAFEFSILDEYNAKDDITPAQLNNELAELQKLHKAELAMENVTLY